MTAHARKSAAQFKAPEGKKISSRNTLKQGFAAKTNVLLDIEDPVAFEAHLAGYRVVFKPAGPVESECCRPTRFHFLAQIPNRRHRNALIQFQLSVQQHKVRELHLDQFDDEHQAKFELTLACQALATRTNPNFD